MSSRRVASFSARRKCIELIPPEKLGFLFEEMSGHAVTAARHRYGCRVLERLLEHCPSSQTAPLIEEVLLGTQQLCRHTFGALGKDLSIACLYIKDVYCTY